MVQVNVLDETDYNSYGFAQRLTENFRCRIRSNDRLRVLGMSSTKFDDFQEISEDCSKGNFAFECENDRLFCAYSQLTLEH